MENGKYVIYNDYVDTKTGLSLPLPDGVEAMVKTGSEMPLYQIIKPNIVNNVILTVRWEFPCLPTQ